MTKRKAFTLVEALVVVAIIGIMVTVAIPAFNRFYQMFKFRTAMNNMVTDIRSVRQAAITNGRPVKITAVTMSDFGEISGMTSGYAIYMLDSTDEDDMADPAHWLEIAPARRPCDGSAGRPEKPRFLQEPIRIDPADSSLEDVDNDSIGDLVFLANGAIYEGPYPQDDPAGAMLVFKSVDELANPADPAQAATLSPGFIMKTTKSTTADRFAIYFSLFGKVSVHPYHS
jgi:prepilin-type N-terminal cleavage/methylation domain-containing protein